MIITGEPQYVGIKRTTEKGNRVGHAMIVYKESLRINDRGREEGVLHIADPNFPGKEREIVLNFDNESFAPYYSGAKAPDNDTEKFNKYAFPRIYFKEKNDLFDPSTEGQELWDAFVGETIGDEHFPDYTLYIGKKNPDYSITRLGELVDEYKVTGYGDFCFEVEVEGTVGHLKIYDENGKYISYDGRSTDLKEGRNRLGFYILGEATYKDADGTDKTSQEFVGFEWLDVIYEEQPSADSLTVTITRPQDGDTYEKGTSVTFTAEAQDQDGLSMIHAVDLVWTSSLDGVIGTEAHFYKGYLSVGTHGITLEGTDEDGNKGTDSITITIEEKDDGDLDASECDATDDLEILGVSERESCPSYQGTPEACADLLIKNNGEYGFSVPYYFFNKKVERDADPRWWPSSNPVLPGETYEQYGWAYQYGSLSYNLMYITAYYVGDEWEGCKWINDYIEDNDELPEGLEAIYVEDLNPFE